MNPSSGACSASPLVVEAVIHDQSTRIMVRGRADSTNRDRLTAGLAAVDVTATSRVEIQLAQLESCDVEAVLELLGFAGDVRDHGGQVALVGATPWVLAMIRLLDVDSVVSLSPADSRAAMQAWLTTDVLLGQATALRQLLTTLDHDGVPGTSHALQRGDARQEPAGPGTQPDWAG